MVVCGIVAEYNPLHAGHEKQIQDIKSRCGNDCLIVAVMSGAFSQRGEVEILPSHVRAMAAVNAGIDLVIELPPQCSLSSAENFATAAINLLMDLKVVNTICYGAETPDEALIKKAATFIVDNDAAIHKLILAYIKNGSGYAKSRELAILNLSQELSLSELLSHGNNILAVEYEKAIYKEQFDLKTIATPLYRKDVLSAALLRTKLALLDRLLLQSNYKYQEVLASGIVCQPDKNYKQDDADISERETLKLCRQSEATSSIYELISELNEYLPELELAYFLRHRAQSIVDLTDFFPLFLQNFTNFKSSTKASDFKNSEIATASESLIVATDTESSKLDPDCQKLNSAALHTDGHNMSAVSDADTDGVNCLALGNGMQGELDKRFANVLKTLQTLPDAQDFSDFLNQVANKNHPLSRVKRAYLNTALEFTDAKPKTLFIRPLAFNRRGQALLKSIKVKSPLPIVTAARDLKNISDEQTKRQITETFKAHDLINFWRHDYRLEMLKKPCLYDQRKGFDKIIELL